jgi:hypothetical protein
MEQGKGGTNTKIFSKECDDSKNLTFLDTILSARPRDQYHELHTLSERDCSTSAARNIKLMLFGRMLGETRTELIANNYHIMSATQFTKMYTHMLVLPPSMHCT